MALHMFIHLSNGEHLGMIHQIGWWRSDNVVSSFVGVPLVVCGVLSRCGVV
jgi:hypothetical protein